MRSEKSLDLIKNMGILTLSNFATKFLVFLLVPLYTSVLSTKEYGSYDLAVSTVTLLYPILSLNIVDAVMRFTMDKTYDKKKISSCAIKITCVSIIVFGIVLLAIRLTGIIPDIKGLEIYMFLYYVSYAINQFLIQLAKGLEAVKSMGISGIISTSVTILANIFFLLIFKLGLGGFFIASILAQAFSGFYLARSIKLFNYIEFAQTDKLLKCELLAYSLPLVASTVGWWINSSSDKYMVALLLGVSANGLLSISYKMPQILNTLQSIFMQAWQISAIKEYGDEDTARFYGRTFTVINLLMCAACSGLILLARPLAHFLYSNDFYDAWRYVPYLLMSCVLNCASGMLGPILSAQKKTKSMMWSAIIGAGVNLLLNLMLIRCVGIQGATLATALCSYVIYVIRKLAVGKHIEIDRYYVVISTWILLFVQAGVEVYIQNYRIELIIMCMFFVINVHSINLLLSSGKKLLKSIKMKTKES